jgi:hypothetical protein
VTRGGLPVALIDWETAGPVDPLAQLGWLNAKLHDDIVAGLERLPPAADRARQLAAIVDGYGLTAAQRRPVRGLDDPPPPPPRNRPHAITAFRYLIADAPTPFQERNQALSFSLMPLTRSETLSTWMTHASTLRWRQASGPR